MGSAELSNKRLVTAILLGIALLVIPAFTIFQILVHCHPVYEASVGLIKADAAAQAKLGQRIETGFWVNGRVRRGGNASFSYLVSGPLGSAEAIVSGVKRGSSWSVEYILLKQPGERTLTLPGARGYVVR